MSIHSQSGRIRPVMQIGQEEDESLLPLCSTLSLALKTTPSIQTRKRMSILPSLRPVLVLTICAIIVMVSEIGSMLDSDKKVLAQSSSSSSSPLTSVISYNANDDDSNENICKGKDPNLTPIACIVNAMVNVRPQAGANVTRGYQGRIHVTKDPILVPFGQVGMCPVNVHWHIGAEHLSVGEYDETGVGPLFHDEESIHGSRQGHRCKLYDENDSRFTTPYEWKYCHGMQVGETYEVHWPHSAAGACGTSNQYQTPFYDGVFCIDGILTDTASQIGVQSQVFTVINDDTYYFAELMQGMIVDGDRGQNVAKYIGSTSGDKFNNKICSQYTPITWQVDRMCHLISASSFDKLCHDMLQQRDDMSDDLWPHGSRETVSDELAATNQHDRFLFRGLY